MWMCSMTPCTNSAQYSYVPVRPYVLTYFCLHPVGGKAREAPAAIRVDCASACAQPSPVPCRKPPPLAAVSVQADCRLQGHADAATLQRSRDGASARQDGEGLQQMSSSGRRQGHSRWQVNSILHSSLVTDAAPSQCMMLRHVR